MGEIAIRAENISKKFTIGKKQSGSIRERFSSLFEKHGDEREFWALKDLNFTVNKGDAVGIIGRNGAGKSTLLKLLSQITFPSKGTIEIDGRVASLLEVGTGFHQELTGRENIYLNGTILGMSRREVKSRIDEIIDFSGVEKFIDTAVKHYSSGMYVRLAFAVAAHLEPEILVIDEVLAVGDSEFQKKCLGKMDDVSHSGNTVLFVSHNMAAVRNLCKKGMFLHNGEIAFHGDVKDAILKYDHLNVVNKTEFDLHDVIRNRGAQIISFSRLKLNSDEYYPDSRFGMTLQLNHNDRTVNIRNIHIAVYITDVVQNVLHHISTLFLEDETIPFSTESEYSFEFDRLDLSPGTYHIWVWLQGNGFEQDFIDTDLSFEVRDGNIYGKKSPKITGIVQKKFAFHVS